MDSAATGGELHRVLAGGAGTPTGVNRLTSRVKAEEELWNKVADELFALDELVARDKHLRQYSKFIKDIFGIKIVCEDDETCRKKVYQALQNMSTQDTIFRAPVGESKRLLEFVETKDYLNCEPAKMKKTGWRAIKRSCSGKNGYSDSVAATDELLFRDRPHERTFSPLVQDFAGQPAPRNRQASTAVRLVPEFAEDDLPRRSNVLRTLTLASLLKIREVPRKSLVLQTFNLCIDLVHCCSGTKHCLSSGIHSFCQHRILGQRIHASFHYHFHE